MLKNYIKIALRNIVRHKGYTFINIFGLATGIICCLLILVYVQDELSYDRYHEKAAQIYRIINAGVIRGNHIEMPLVSGPWGPAMVEELPEVLKAVRIKPPDSRWVIEHGERRFPEKGLYFTDPTFFEVFDVEMVVGNPAHVLDAPFSMVITEEMAEKYFGSEDPIGKIIVGDNWMNFNITGIMRKHPPSTHMNYDFLVNFETLNRAVDPINKQPYYGDLSTNWQNFRIYTYLLLDAHADPAAVEAKMRTLIEERLGKMLRIAGVELNPYLQKLTDIHLKSDLEGEIGPTGDESYIYIFSAVAIFILLIACINFMNLSTARSENRAKEVGIRKAVGADRVQLMKQFLGESIIFTFFASVIAGIAVLFLLTPFNTIAEKNISASSLINGQTTILLIGLVLMVGFVSGSYPAFLLSAFRPAEVLSGKKYKGASGGLLRKILVVVQFSISVFLIIGLSVIYSQMGYIKSRPLGYDKENILAVPLSDPAPRSTYESYKTTLLSNSHVKSVSAASTLPGGLFGIALLRPVGRPPNENLTVQIMTVDYDFIETLGIELHEGRDFSREFTTDLNRALLLNEEAVKQFGFDSGLDKRLSPGGLINLPVIGVLKDYYFKSLHQKIEPFALSLATEQAFNWVFIKTTEESMPEVMQFSEQEWRRINPGHPFEYTFVDRENDMMYQSEMKLSRLSSIFTIIAIYIACLGLFGLASFTVVQRTKEIGMRKILGASTGGIVLILSKEYVKWVVLANVFAWPLAYYLMRRWLEGFAYHTSLNIMAFFASGILALFIALLTVSFQTFKAATANPVDSLRYE
ncbi:MAG: ABC transporter permease [Candidatus Aminicenantes bacterium]|jgi:putative ABC transport system permease protein